jgi:hypothetical protein
MIETLENTELEKQAISWPDRARAIVIVDQLTYDIAAELIRSIAGLEHQIIDHHKPVKEAAWAAHKAAVAAEKRLLDPLTIAKGIIKSAIGKWEQDQARIRAEAQRIADETARKIEEEARVNLAIQAEQMGATEATTAEIMAKPLPMAAPVVPPAFNRAAGVSARKVWKWKLANESLVPRFFMSIDESKINKVVASLGPNANIPGIEVFEQTNITVRR